MNHIQEPVPGDDTVAVRDPASTSGPGHGKRRRGRRAAIVAGVVVLVLVALFYLGGGWFFSSQIYGDGLQVDHSGPDHDLSVVAVRDGVVVLGDEAAGDESPMRRSGIYGLDWGDGYGQVWGEPRPAADGDVIRRLRVLQGRPPQVGDRAAADRSSFSDVPSLALGRDVDEVTYDSPLGPTQAWYADGAGKTWVILVHGHRSNRAEMLRPMQVSVAAGLPSLAISYRNDPGAPQDPSGQYGFGTTEWRDLEAAVRYALGRGATQVKLVGSSMGGAVVASFLERSPLADRVSALVLESPMLDFGETVAFGASQIEVPLLGGVPESLVWTAQRLAAARYGLDWDSVDYLDDTSWVTVPTLLVRDTHDQRQPPTTSEQLARAHPDLVRLERFEDAEHVGAWNHDPRRYRRLVSAFLTSPSTT